MNFRDFFPKHIVSEAISLKQSKKKNLTRKASGAYKINQLKKIFGDKDRLVFPIEVNAEELIKPKDNPLVEKIFDKLHKNFNMTIRTRQDYIRGVAYKILDNEKKQPQKIGKLLNKLGQQGDEDAKQLFEAFRDDPERSAKNASKFFVVISRHPYDVAGMSSDRNWTSCMNLGMKAIEYKEKGKQDQGINARYVPNDIREGSIVAYLVADEDRHPNGKLAIRRPLSRILMKPHVNNDDSKDFAYSKGRSYGVTNEAFNDFITVWLTSEVNNDTKGKSYTVAPGLYNDADTPVNFKKDKRKSSAPSIAFFNELGYARNVPDKYHNMFTVNSAYGYGGGEGFEIQIRFDLPENMKIHDFHYTYNDTKPAFVKQILKHAGISRRGDYYQVESVTADTPNAIIVEYSYMTEYFDEIGGKQEPTEDDLVEMWENIITENLKLRQFDYVKVRKSIIDILEKFNLVEETEKEKLGLAEYFQQSLTPFIKNTAKYLKEGLSHAENISNQLQSLNQAENPMISLYEYLITHPHEENYIRDYKNELRAVQNELSRINPARKGNYFFAEAIKEWERMSNEYLGLDDITKRVFDKLNGLRPIKLMIGRQRERYVQMEQEFMAKYNDRIFDSINDWINDITTPRLYNAMAPLLKR